MKHDYNRPILFIAGLNRSGTSLLHEILKKHPCISGFENTGVLKDEGQHLQSVYPIQKVHGGAGKFAFHKEAYINESSALVTDTNRRVLFNEWARHWDTSKPLLIEKSPSNLIRMRFLQAFFPQSLFIILIRHPVAVGYATQKWSKTDIRELVEHWVVAHQIMMEDLWCIKKYIILRYEDFINAPEETLALLCKKIGLNGAPPSFDVKTAMNVKYFNMWEQESKENSMLLRRVRLLWELPEQFGYRFTSPYIEPSAIPLLSNERAFG